MVARCGAFPRHSGLCIRMTNYMTRNSNIEVLFACEGVKAKDWLSAFANIRGDLNIQVSPDVGACESIQFGVAWNNPRGFWRRFPNLRAIFSLGAGVDGLLSDPELPVDIPIVRMLDGALADEMAEFVMARVIHHHRLLHRYEVQQSKNSWSVHRPPMANQRVVGIMGLGALGSRCANELKQRGFHVRGWARTCKELSDIDIFYGWDRLADFVTGCEILVCLLPRTLETEGILSSRLFSRLAPGACLINVGRGAHLVESDLLDAIDRGFIEAATLDVFHDEPLPETHPFWTCSAIRIFPHVAAFTRPETASKVISDNIDRILSGKSPVGVVERVLGY